MNFASTFRLSLIDIETSCSLLLLVFFYVYGHHRDLHSFPTRRSSDLDDPLLRDEVLLAFLLRDRELLRLRQDRKSTRLNSSHVSISYAVFCLKKKTSHQ